MSTYKIKNGDTLGALAQRYNTTVAALAKANNIKNPDLIFAGKSLKVPDGFDGPERRSGADRRSAPGPTERRSGSTAAGHDHGHDAHVHPEGRTTTSRTNTDASVRAGGGWGGSENVANAAKDIARDMGIPVTSQKRDLAATRRVGSTTGSDHFTGNTNAFATDFGVSGRKGDQLAREIARKYGIPESNIGTYNRHTITVDGQKYSIQLLWKVKGHYDHVHLGIRRA